MTGTQQLPVEIILNIVEHYAALRQVEIAERGRFANDHHRSFVHFVSETIEDVPPTWPIIPLLVSNKLFYALVLPLVYREVTTMPGGLLKKFCLDPALSSYDHVRKLVLHARELEETDDELKMEDLVDQRKSQMLVRSFLQHAWQDRAIERPFSDFRLDYKLWRDCLRPQVDLMTVSDGALDYELKPLTSLFRVKHLVIDYVTNGPSSCMELHSCAKVTLKRNPTRSYLYHRREIHGAVWLEQSNFSGTLEIANGRLPHDDGRNDSVDPETGLTSTFTVTEIMEDVVRTFFGRRKPLKAITVTTILGTGENSHAWCFPGPMKTLVTPGPYPDIEFKSICDCGNGKKTKYWDDLEAQLRTMILEKIENGGEWLPQ